MDTFEGISEQLAKREAKEKQAKKELSVLMLKHYPEGKDEDITAYKVLARLIELFDLDDSGGEVGTLYLQWTASAFIEKKAEKYIPRVDHIYDCLVKGGFNEDNPFVFNDLDNSMFFLPHESKRVLALTSQNCRWLFVRWSEKLLDDNAEYLYVYRYWDTFDFADTDRKEEAEEYLREGVRHALLQGEWLTSHYSDNVEGLEYDPDRPDLQWYKKHNFETTYNDCRAGGFVVSCETGFRGHLDQHAMSRFADIKAAFLDLYFAYCEFSETGRSN